MAKYLNVGTGGFPQEQNTIAASAGAADADKIVATNASGQIDSSFYPSGLNIPKSFLASEAISARDLVNIHNNAGTANIRKADASTASAAKQAHGIALAAAAQNAQCSVLLGMGIVPGFSGLTPGATYFLSAATPGGNTATPPATAGHTLQQIGVAVSGNEVFLLIQEPIIRG